MDANVIFGAVVQEEMEGQLCVTVIATGFGKQKQHIGELQKGALLGLQQPRTQTLRKPAYKRKEEDQQKDEKQPAWAVPKARENLEVPAFLRRNL